MLGKGLLMGEIYCSRLDREKERGEDENEDDGL
jgi:hypothetical protein